jgi:hypothetical protein
MENEIQIKAIRFSKYEIAVFNALAKRAGIPTTSWMRQGLRQLADEAYQKLGKGSPWVNAAEELADERGHQ